MPLTQVPSGMLQTTAQYYGFKNRIINGAMVIDQRNAGASFTPTDGQYTLDRFALGLSQASKFSIQQTTNVPTGFANSLKATVLSAVTVGSSDYFFLLQSIEGYNIADLGWGTANAKTVTLSFQVYSSLTGTFGGAIYNQNSGAPRSYPFTYTVSSANTWTSISVTIAGDTSGTWATTNGAGMTVRFGLGAGSSFSGTAGAWAGSNLVSATGATSVVATNTATFYITGVQLEAGSTATSFDYRPYGTELALCQRYYWSGGNFPGAWASTSQIQVIAQNPVQMRTTPTVAAVSTLNAWNPIGADVAVSSLAAVSNQTTFHSKLTCNTAAAGGLSTGMGGWTYPNTTGTFTFSAEL